MLALLDRLDWVRALGVDARRAARVHPARLARLVEEGGIMNTQHLAGLEPTRRAALLVAQVADLRARLADATLAMFCKYTGSLFTKARNRDDRRFQATRRDIARTLLLFRRTIAALQRAREAGEEGVAAVEREVGMTRLADALPVIDAAAGVAEPEILATVAERYAVLRRFVPRFLAAFEFRSNTPRDPLLAALAPPGHSKRGCAIPICSQKEVVSGGDGRSWWHRGRSGSLAGAVSRGARAQEAAALGTAVPARAAGPE
jgi:hypothetical protein